MQPMTKKERVENFLARKPIDRIPIYEHIWSTTHEKWMKEGRISPDEDLGVHFGYDIREASPFILMADPDFTPVILEENEDTYVALDGNGAKLRRHKHKITTPEHVDFTVKERSAWEEFIRPRLIPADNRIRFDRYRKARTKAAVQGEFFCCSGINVFECMHPVCGHEHMLVGMALDPGWVRDMADTYADLTVNLMEILFKKEGPPDGIWFYEDMGFKERPFMSPAMYREIIQPAHKRTIDFAKSLGLPVIMHSCGCVEKLIPGMMEAGIDCLQVIEVKAGMDLIKLYHQYGDDLSFMGGMDVRVLYTNDLSVVEKELTDKIPIVKEKFGYALHSDHSIPDTVDYDTYRYFLRKGLELGTYQKG